MKTYLSVALTLALLALVPASAFAVLETEPNDSKALANPIALPAVNTLAAITGNSTSATGVGLDYFNVTTAAQATAGFYRHRLIAVSTTVGHTLTVRGLSQTGGVVNPGTDITFQTSSTATTPPRFIQWYTSQAPGQVIIRVTGTAATTADYDLNYEVAPVTEIAGPTGITPGTVIISTVGQTTVDTELWVYDSTRAPIPLYGNDNEPAPGTTSQSLLNRTYAAGSFHLAVSPFELGPGNLNTPPDDRFLTGPVLDFATASGQSSTAINQILNPVIGGTPVPATKTDPYQLVFISFGVGAVGPCIEVEPNDAKGTATPCTLPATNQTAVIQGNSTSATTTGLDYFRVTTAAQATPGFYRHRLTVQSATVGHTATIRGLSQTGGVINPTSDIAVQTSSAATAPPRTIQWYTSEAGGDLFIRVTGAAATTADYTLDYEVQPVTEIAGPTGITPGSLTITTVGQTTVDTDLWVYNAARTAIPTFGNDDHFMGATLQSELIRTYAAGTYHLSISNFQWANNQPAPPDDDFQNGNVTDFAGVIANSSTTANLILNPMIGGTSVPATKPAFFDVVFISFGVGAPTCNEVEPNDTKATATPCTLPATNQTAAIQGNSTSATGAGIDTYRLTTAAQAAPGFYRHRLIIQSTTVGHTGTIRGFSQLNGVINTTSDIAFQTSSAATTPPRFVQWYTDGGARDIFVRITGAAATTADYVLDYEVQPVTEVAGPTNAPMGLTITSEGQTTVDTDLWVYDAARAAIVDFGNDDTFGGTTLQSTLTRTYMPGTYHLGISSFQMGNNLASPPDDDFRNGNVLDFAGNIANSVTTLNQDVDVLIGSTPVTLLKAGPYDVVFASFTVIVPVELLDFNVE